MRGEPRWLTGQDIVDINRREVEATGEPFGILQESLLDGALARPVNLWSLQGEEDIVVLATRLLTAIAAAHAFQQGNKRTAWAACGIFLALNGYEVRAPDTVEFAETIIGLVERTRSEAAFVALFRDFVEPIAKT